MHLDFNEESPCDYRTQPDFFFGEGTPLGNANSTAVEAPYRPEQPDPFYILCKDAFDNQGKYTIFPLAEE